MSEREFSIGGREFKLCKVDAFKQFHIARKLAPILADVLPSMKKVQAISAKTELTEAEKFDQFAELAAPFMTGISKLSDEDSDKVLFGLLSAVEVKQTTGNWAKVANGSMLMMQDLELPVLLQLAGRAFMYNLSGFFGAAPRQS